MSTEQTKVKRDEVIELFGDVDNFRSVHEQDIKKMELESIEKYLEL